MKRIIILIAFIFFIVISKVSGQVEPMNSTIYPTGISLQYGMGNYSVKDEYISNEKYSGTLPQFSFKWARAHNKYVYKLEMDYRNSSEITNYNVSTDIIQFSFNQGFLYPLKKRVFLNKDLFLWMGPSTEILLFFNDPDIAVTGFDYAQSFAILISASYNTDTILQIKPNLLLESSLKLSIISLGLRMVDSEEDDESTAKLLTLLSGLNSSFDLGMRYYIFSNLSVKLAYRSEIIRISSWEPLLSVSDNIAFGLHYKF